MYRHDTRPFLSCEGAGPPDYDALSYYIASLVPSPLYAKYFCVKEAGHEIVVWTQVQLMVSFLKL